MAAAAPREPEVVLMTPKLTEAHVTQQIKGLPITFIIDGAPRTKKNHGRRIKRGTRTYTIPSEAYMVWNEYAVLQLRQQFKGFPITCNENCRALILRHATAGDAVGYYQAIADTLENAGVLVNDRQIVSWDGSRLDKDAMKPRVIVTLEAI